MMKITVGSTNPAKIAQIRDALAPAGIDVRGITDKRLLPEVIEDQRSVQENARKKALAYAKALGELVLSVDNALFLDGLPPEQQPGMYVRRIGGREAATDTDLLRHGSELVQSLGGRTTGYWEYGICVASPEGKTWETTIRTPRVFTSEASSAIVPGYPLESIQIDPETGKYIAEMTAAEQAAFWQRTLGEPLRKFFEGIR
ncbi:hypothetical protein C4552_02380 [Candidatus Parcubacteria bacterium]|nr:MAG: hypothetical protein C4552_02380 [Candidatus Parcubacteria bacterium]